MGYMINNYLSQTDHDLSSQDQERCCVQHCATFHFHITLFRIMSDLVVSGLMKCPVIRFR